MNINVNDIVPYVFAFSILVTLAFFFYARAKKKTTNLLYVHALAVFIMFFVPMLVIVGIMYIYYFNKHMPNKVEQ